MPVGRHGLRVHLEDGRWRPDAGPRPGGGELRQRHAGVGRPGAGPGEDRR